MQNDKEEVLRLELESALRGDEKQLKKYGLKVSYCCISHLGRYVISNGKFYIDILVKSQVSYGEKKWKAARAVFVPLTSVL